MLLLTMESNIMNPEDFNNKYQELCNLQCDLTSPVSPIGDWKVAKHQEYTMLGLEAPYDPQELHLKRQAVRDKINVLKEELNINTNTQE